MTKYERCQLQKGCQFCLIEQCKLDIGNVPHLSCAPIFKYSIIQMALCNVLWIVACPLVLFRLATVLSLILLIAPLVFSNCSQWNREYIPYYAKKVETVMVNHSTHFNKTINILSHQNIEQKNPHGVGNPGPGPCQVQTYGGVNSMYSLYVYRYTSVFVHVLKSIPLPDTSSIN